MRIPEADVNPDSNRNHQLQILIYGCGPLPKLDLSAYCSLSGAQQVQSAY
jgi:hypothetical protein